ncbi:unnamed protein product [Victoria cruziana]
MKAAALKKNGVLGDRRLIPLALMGRPIDGTRPAQKSDFLMKKGEKSWMHETCYRIVNHVIGFRPLADVQYLLQPNNFVSVVGTSAAQPKLTTSKTKEDELIYQPSFRQSLDGSQYGCQQPTRQTRNVRSCCTFFNKAHAEQREKREGTGKTPGKSTKSFL